ncbi:ubiquitin carboxyl-terminal hydrolase-related protein [Actinidia rufa]|uniref:Ubiquitin carboxyl-terminal hydrolase-related protein n=1 Tax=Actinidia rufa TaxID=165716 RepID=A0A7J0DY10_9ERIC|nr:ubiquitin carboxyl-terminal hydrolase-related protein [Actinidia rufa]
MVHRDPSLGKSKMPEDSSGVPVRAKSPKDSSSASASRKNRRRSRSHNKVKQDTLPAQKNLPLTTSQPSEALLEEKKEVGLRVLLDSPWAGMKNDPGEFNCFLNVVVQPFRHLETFRDEFLSRSKSAHVHIGNPCVVCALHKVFKIRPAKTPFDEFFKLVRKFHETFICDPNAKHWNGYGIPCHILSTHSHVFTLVLGWGTPSESMDHISETLEVQSTDIDLGVLFDCLDPGHMHSLISIVCYWSQHYICFVYSCEQEEWIVYDNAIVKVIGRWEWDNAILECKKRKFQHTILFFESVE